MTERNFTEAVQQSLCGFDQHLGIRLLEASAARVRAELPIEDKHRQIHGVVHGGVYSCLVETLGSIGAALNAREFGRTIVGIENHTSFLRATGHGSLHAEAEPLAVGRRSQVWATRIRDDEGRLVATGQLRIMCLEAGTVPDGNSDKTGGIFRT